MPDSRASGRGVRAPSHEESRDGRAARGPQRAQPGRPRALRCRAARRRAGPGVRPGDHQLGRPRPAGRRRRGRPAAARPDRRRPRSASACSNTPDFVVAYFGALRAGLVAVPLNTGYTADELRHALGDSGARALVAGRGTLTAAAEAAADLPGWSTCSSPAATPATGSSCDDVLDASAGPVQAPTGGEDLAVVLYTSGTSGRPRGAMLSHRALLANLDQGSRIDPPVVAGDDVVLLVLPLFHVYGLNAALGAVAAPAATGRARRALRPGRDARAEVAPRGVTNVVGRPADVRRLVDAAGRRRRLRHRAAGAVRAPPRCRRAVLHRVLDVTGHHVFEGYGLTETAPVLTSTLMSEVAKPGSIGRPIPGVELRLRRRARRRRSRRATRARSSSAAPNLFSGYWPDGERRPRRRRLVRHRRRRVPRRRRRPAPRRPAARAGPGQRLQRLPARGRGRAARATPTSRRRPSSASRTPTPASPSRRWSSRAPGARPTAEELIAHCARVAGPLQVPDRGRVRRRAAAHRDRQGQQGPAARAVRPA